MTEGTRVNTWHVTTESDVEGHGVRDLGVHHGSLEDVAFALADQACWSLEFRIAPKGGKKGSRVAWITIEPKRSEVVVRLSVESVTWGMTARERVAYFRRMLDGRDVEVLESKIISSVLLRRGASTQTRLAEATGASGPLRGWRWFIDGDAAFLEPPVGEISAHHLAAATKVIGGEAKAIFRELPRPGVYLRVVRRSAW